MSDRLSLYIATRHMPPANSGGPGAAARLLFDAVTQSGGDDIRCKLLVGGSLVTRSGLHSAPDSSPSVATARGPWHWLEKRPNNIALNAAHHVSVAMQKARTWEMLEADLVETPAVAFAFGSSIGQALTPNRRPRQVKVVLSEHSKGGASQEYAVAHPERARSLLVRRMRWLESQTARFSDRVVFPSRGALDLFCASHPEVAWELEQKAVVIHNGIPDPFVPAEQRPSEAYNLILNVAQHVREKGIGTALAGVADFFSTGGQGVFRNFGAATELTSALERQVRSYGFAERMALAGTIDRAELLRMMQDAFVVVSTPEVAVFDLVVLEAMALAKPVIATRVGGNIEALGEKYPLYASDSSDVTRQLQILRANPEFANDLGKRNRERFLEHFTTKSFLRKHVDLCRELTANRCGSAIDQVAVN